MRAFRHGPRRIAMPHPSLSGFLCLTVLAAATCAPTRGEIVFQTQHLRLAIRDDGTLRSLTSQPAGVEYAAGAPCPLAMAYRGGRAVSNAEGPYAAVVGRWIYQGGSPLAATRVSRQEDQLTIDFGSANVRATLQVHSTEDYLAFKLLSVEGDGIDRIDLLRLNLRRPPFLGQWVNAAWDDDFGVCLCAGNLQTNAEMWPQDQNVLMTATAEAAVGFRGATAVLFGCPEPKTRFLDAMAVVERDFDLPSGAAFRRSPSQKFSYLWATRPTPETIDQYIHWAKLGGFRVLLLSYTAFAKGPGHLLWNDAYPRGMADLRQVTDAIRGAGLKAGLHLHYSKAGKNDPYVTPVPDDRFHKVRTFTLAAPVSSDAAVLPVKETPAGCTLDKDRRLLKLQRELIEYEGYDAQPPYRFTGCRRGHLGTTPAAHAEGNRLDLLDVDTWPAFVRYDQNTDIQDEAARRIAEIYRETGPYEMVYFDGAEDVHEPFWHHVAGAQYRVFRLLDPPPPVCESAHYTHFSWHMISRSNAYDVIAPPDRMKDFCRLMPCPTAAARAWDFSRIQFGWLGRFGRSAAGAAEPDVYEYVASRAAAWDCPISLHASLEELESNPRAEDCLAAIKIWEDARVGNHLSGEDRQRLKNVAPEEARYVPCFEQREIFQRIVENRDLTDAQRRILADRREHHLLRNEQGRYELVEIEDLSAVAPDGVRVYVFRRAAAPQDAYLLAWAAAGQLRLRLSIPAKRLAVMRPLATPQPFSSQGEASEVSLGPRTYLVLRDTTLDAAREILARTEVVR